MRLWGVLVGASVVIGVGIALLAHAVSGSSNGSETGTPCTAEGLALAPTFALVDDGRKAKVGLQASGATGGFPCRVPSGQSRVFSVLVQDPLGNVLLRHTSRTGPPAGAQVSQPVTFAVTAAALKFCTAKQPLHFDVTALGNHAAGSLSLSQVGDSCALG